MRATIVKSVNGIQGRRKHLKSGRARSKKGHMATPTNGQSNKMLESIQNHFHAVFGRELKIIGLRVYVKNCYLYGKCQR